MSGKWIMTERKVIRVAVPVAGSHHPPMVQYVDKIHAVGDPVPAGHEGKPYTRQAADETPAAHERIEDPAPNRMLDATHATKRHGKK